MRIWLPQLNKSFDVEKDTNLFKALKAAGVPIASSCNGDGICGKCIVVCESGELPPPQSLEQKLIDKLKLSSRERLSCQCTVSSDLTLKTTYW